MRIRPLLLLALALPAALHAQPPADSLRWLPGRTWSLSSGGVTYRVADRGGHLLLDYFGPGDSLARWDSAGSRWPSEEMPDFRVAGAAATSSRAGVHALRVPLRASTPSGPWGALTIDAVYETFGETGVFTRRLVLRNAGARALPVPSSLPLVSWGLPNGPYIMRTLWGGWGQERQLAVEPVTHGARRFEQTYGRSSRGLVPWLSLRDEGRGVEYVAELAWSGNWWMEVERHPDFWSEGLHDRPLAVRVGLRHDGGGALTLAPGETLELPAVVFTAARGDLDDAANRMHRWQREWLIPRQAANDPPLVQFNSWYPFNDSVSIAQTKASADAAARLGAEVYIHDSGWYNDADWSRELGDYRVNRRKYPNGLEELADHVRARGMKFGLWVEIENVGLRSRVLREHPEWCLTRGGRPVSYAGDRCQLDFARPAVRAWAHGVIDRLVKDYGLAWIKIDYNVDVGDRFDPSASSGQAPAPGGHAGGRLFDHVRAYYAWLDEVRARHPDLVVESCASGGLRFDVGIMGHAHTTWLSDRVDPVMSLALQWGCTLQFAARACNHWMVGDTDRGVVKPGAPPGWWDFLFRVPMNGQFGISSHAETWDSAQVARGRANVRLYERVRGTIARGDVYHLTPQPAMDAPRGWMAIEYAEPDSSRAVVSAFRLAGGAADTTFALRGLRPSATYELRRDGEAAGRATGAELARGLRVALPDEWRAVVLEITSVP